MNFWKMPLDSFYKLKMYREVQRASLGKGFLYLLYLSGIVTLLFLVLLSTQIMPLADDFSEWFQETMPSIVWTPEQISIQEPSPYTMFHPEFGPFIIFQTDRTELSFEELQGAPVHVTSNKVYVSRGSGEVRVYDLNDPALQTRPGQEPVLIGPEFVRQYYGVFKPWAYILSFIFYLPAIFIWKSIAAFFYSWIALIFNQFRSEKLEYGTLYQLCLYAMTPATLLASILPVIPGLNRIPFGLPASLLVTGGYLFFAIKKTETPPPAIS